MEATVVDSFEIKGRVAVEYGQKGVVAIFGQPAGMAEPVVGQMILVVRPDGWMLRSIIREVKEHGPEGRSVFLRDLTKSDVPIGSRLYWGPALREHLMEASQEAEFSGRSS